MLDPQIGFSSLRIITTAENAMNTTKRLGCPRNQCVHLASLLCNIEFVEVGLDLLDGTSAV